MQNSDNNSGVPRITAGRLSDHPEIFLSYTLHCHIHRLQTILSPRKKKKKKKEREITYLDSPFSASQTSRLCSAFDVLLMLAVGVLLVRVPSQLVFVRLHVRWICSRRKRSKLRLQNSRLCRFIIINRSPCRGSASWHGSCGQSSILSRRLLRKLGDCLISGARPQALCGAREEVAHR